jgi:hypothetical protein
MATVWLAKRLGGSDLPSRASLRGLAASRLTNIARRGHAYAVFIQQRSSCSPLLVGWLTYRSG